MSFCVPRTDWSTHQKVPTPVHEDVAATILDFLFNNRAALATLPNDHPIARMIRDARPKLWKEPAPPAAAVPPVGADAPSWQDEAVAMRKAGQSWEAIVAATGQPKTTVRRVVSRALAGRG